MSIPKILHYVWPGHDEKSDLAKYCIKSWYDKLPAAWVIKEWNPGNFDFEKTARGNRFFQEMYERKMYAFMADYIRCAVLYKYGGVYVDTDVEMLKPFSDEMLECRIFLPVQNQRFTEPAIWGAVPGHFFLKEVAGFYEKDVWLSPEYTLPEILGSILEREYKLSFFGEKDKQIIFSTQDGAITFYPQEYFVPFAGNEKSHPNGITANTHTIHWFNGNWNKNTDDHMFLKNKAGNNIRRNYEIKRHRSSLFSKLRQRVKD